MYLKKKHIPFILMIIWAGNMFSQEISTDIRIEFRVNSTLLDTTYRDNARQLDRIVEFFNKVNTNRLIKITEVSFTGTSSPEGGSDLNRRLARGRLSALEKLIRSRINVPELLISRDDEYIPWGYLYNAVSESEIGHKSEILSIIRNESDNNRILELKRLDGGNVWKELLNSYFIPMRNASVVFTTVIDEIPKVKSFNIVPPSARRSVKDEIVPVEKDTVKIEEVEPPYRRRLYLKSNLIGLTMAIANLAAELDLGSHWSVSLPVCYSAWNYFSPIVKFRTFSLQPEVRYWFSGDNDHWFLGAHAGLSYYNFAIGGKYRTQDHNGTSPSVGGGISAGYRLPISKNNRWKMEFALGAGVYPLHYDEFDNTENGQLAATHRKTYFGIDQAAVSLSYTFNLKQK